MKVREILELTQSTNIAAIAKQINGISEKPLRALLKEIGCEPNGSGKKGWHYSGSDESILEKDILEFVPEKKTNKPTAKRKPENQNKNISSKTEKKPETQKINNSDQTENKPIETRSYTPEMENQPTNTPEPSGNQLKKVTYEIPEWMHDELRIKSIREKRKVSDIVAELIRRGLEE